MYDHNQLYLPDSFLALYCVRGQRPTLSREALQARYELCEDLASLLVEQCSTVLQRDGLAEDIVLARCLEGLRAAPATLAPVEAVWVVRRTAELLQWEWPELPAAG